MDKNQNEVHFYMGSHIERKNGKGGFIYEYYSDFFKNFFLKRTEKVLSMGNYLLEPQTNIFRPVFYWIKPDYAYSYKLLPLYINV